MKCDELQYERIGDANKTYPASTLVVRKQFVDAAIAELKKEIERCQRYHDAEAVKWLAVTAKAETENRKLKRALWMARAEMARTSAWVFWNRKDDYNYNKWKKVERKCRAKAEEYK